MTALETRTVARLIDCPCVTCREIMTRAVTRNPPIVALKPVKVTP